MPYTIEYKQTPHERYRTNMNDRVRTIIEDFGATIVGESGGSGGPPEERVAMVADASFTFKATHANTLDIQRTIAKLLDRQVTRTFEEPEEEKQDG